MLAEFEESLDACRCGRTDGECGDSETDWYPVAEVCWPTAVLRATERLYEKRHHKYQYHDGSFQNWAKEPSTAYPFHAMDGVDIWVTRQEPGEDYDDLLDLLGRSAEEPVGEQPEPAEQAADGD